MRLSGELAVVTVMRVTEGFLNMARAEMNAFGATFFHVVLRTKIVGGRPACNASCEDVSTARRSFTKNDTSANSLVVRISAPSASSIRFTASRAS
jgi:hypothetical protein